MVYEVVSDTDFREGSGPASRSSEADTCTITARGLTKSFGASQVLRGVDLAVPRGTLLALLGPNGAGKTTTVRILSTLLRPDAGTATVGGHDVVTDPQGVHAVLGLTGQYTAIDGLLTGRENLMMIGRLNHLRRRDARGRVDRLLEQFDLVDAARRPAHTYSGGMRRRLDLAASLIGDPSVVFLDEPTAGLDPRARQALWQVVRDLLAQGTTILLTTQYLDEADRLADRVAVIDAGRVVAEGTADQLKREVGAERALLTFAPTDLVRAGRALDGSGVVTHTETSQISVQMEGPEQLRHLLNHLDAVGIEPTDLAVARPTLDDVFLTLTDLEAA